MEKKSYYAIIPANIRYDKRIRANAKLLYGEITALCNEKGYCWASNNYFAELYGVSKVSISLWIKELESCGYILSELNYKEGSKEVESRHITLAAEIPPIKEKLNTPLRKVKGGIKEKLNTPIKEKLKDNNTVINNTFNNERESQAQILMITTFGRNPKLPELDIIYEHLDKFGFEKTKRIYKEAVLSNFYSLKTLDNQLDDNGNIKPKGDNGINKGFNGASLNSKWDEFTDN